ncbi:uncharacterized protein HLK63_G01419 [Nakaseomyces glabratus]|nr:uncharacterized protein GW608_G01419 [Nakaseomyces glabratus]UCS25631.1 uncharacterized protein HLK63_G01419 [Nakaseomyces glabratus]UCS30861.1 uncharacterized protein HLK64_G01419 [Nakaseomyces glabratus]UCS36090.1 uncharacterized protein HLK62_G01419 [Nakaseomyces glabratus]
MSKINEDKKRYAISLTEHNGMISATIYKKTYLRDQLLNGICVIVIELLFYHFLQDQVVSLLRKASLPGDCRLHRLLLSLLCFHILNTKLVITIETVTVIPKLGVQISKWHIQSISWKALQLWYEHLSSSDSTASTAAFDTIALAARTNTNSNETTFIPRDRVVDIIIHETFSKTGFGVSSHLSILYNGDTSNHHRAKTRDNSRAHDGVREPCLRILYESARVRLPDQIALYNKLQRALHAK